MDNRLFVFYYIGRWKFRHIHIQPTQKLQENSIKFIRLGPLGKTKYRFKLIILRLNSAFLGEKKFRFFLIQNCERNKSELYFFFQGYEEMKIHF